MDEDGEVEGRGCEGEAGEEAGSEAHWELNVDALEWKERRGKGMNVVDKQ